MGPSIIWFRQDLRLADNPALKAAYQKQSPIVPLYILEDVSSRKWEIGVTQRWWLYHSLSSLEKSLKRSGLKLILRKGTPLIILKELIQEIQATSVYWNRCYEPTAILRDQQIKQDLIKEGIEVKSFNGSLLFEPWEITTQKGEPYKNFTHYWKSCLTTRKPTLPQEKPKHLISFSSCLKSDLIDEWGLATHDFKRTKNFSLEWEPGEEEAEKKLNSFVQSGAIHAYHVNRNHLAYEATSKLSPYLHLGEISPRQIWHTILRTVENSKGVEAFLSELGWREFSYYLLYHFPTFPDVPFRPQFHHFKWHSDKTRLTAWQKGLTGYPLVDAGMRQLETIGWMHNRVRMITASFLTKHLLIDWREGEKWFWDSLLDADLANNSVAWQWTAGSGVDAAPYFRIFNPVLQGEKFDPQGIYVKKWVPELSGLPAHFIHKPWKAPYEILQKANIVLGKDYPFPLVDHISARNTALEAYEALRR